MFDDSWHAAVVLVIHEERDLSMLLNNVSAMFSHLLYFDAMKLVYKYVHRE